MLDLVVVKAAFNSLTDIAPLGQPSGQKFVYRAKKNGQLVCLKIVKPTAESEPRAKRELDAVERLKSGYVPQLIEKGEIDLASARHIYMVEQFVEGKGYRDILNAQRVQPVKEVLDLGESLLAACTDFEKSKLVHRDLKPENLIIDATGKLWVLDFGIVRFLDMKSITHDAAQGGPCTIGYGAPEQLRNRKVEISTRTDIFSIGVIMYEALAGGNPYYLQARGNPFAVIDHTLNRDLPKLQVAGDKNGKLADFVATMTARFPSRRPQTATEALDMLKEVRSDLGV